VAVDEPPTPEGQSPVTKDSDILAAPRSTSAKQLEANRKNALRSTGPTTPKGKQVSRLNALKHGLQAKEVLIPGEDPADFDAMKSELRDDLKPEGHMESHFVDQIGFYEWNLRRVRRAEAGAIRGQILSATESDVEDEIDRPYEDSAELLPEILPKTSAGIASQRAAVEKALDELGEGTLSRQTCDHLEGLFGTEMDSPAPMVKAYFLAGRPEGEDEDLEDNGEPTTTADGVELNNPAAVRRALEATLKTLGRQARKLRKKEKTDLEITRLRLSILHSPQLGDFQRYETATLRNMARALAQLERLQRRRRGEPPTPTVNVNVSSDDDD
jgi:hypothetical protein